MLYQKLYPFLQEFLTSSLFLKTINQKNLFFFSNELRNVSICQKGKTLYMSNERHLKMCHGFNLKYMSGKLAANANYENVFMVINLTGIYNA